MAGVFAFCFFLAMIMTGRIINHEGEDMTADMSRASLPVIYVIEEDRPVNMHAGYTMDMEINYLRETISPLSGDRELKLLIDTFGILIDRISYEVRSIDTARLIEDAEISDYEKAENRIRTNIRIKDLIEPELEYMLIVKLTLPGGVVSRYYIRFMEKDELGIAEKQNFVLDFSEKTFDKEAAEELRQYMESNRSGDNSSFGYVNIHSNFQQLTWGELNPVVTGEKQLNILEIDRLNGSFELKYTVQAAGELYRIREYFRIREGAKRMYLMEYERTMDQIISDEEGILVNKKLLHGILSEPISSMENDDGTIYAFVQQNRLYSYNSVSGSLSRVFSFWDEENDDVRTINDAHGIKLISLDEQGNIVFLVYGYMNRGSHEGEEGIVVYYYDSVINSLEEQLFLPVTRSSQILAHDVSVLSNINYRGLFYLYLDSAVYTIDLSGRQAEVIAEGLDESRFFSSNNNNVISWQPETNLFYSNTIRLMTLDTGRAIDLSGGVSDVLMPLGFIGEDLIYGKIKAGDITTDPSGSSVAPMYEICIVDPNGRELMNYRKPDSYITEIEIDDNIVHIHRAVKDEEGSFIPIEDDQIMTNESSETALNVYTSVVTEEMETTWQTVLKREEIVPNVRVLTPKEVIFEENRDLLLAPDTSVQKFYIYAKGDLDSIYTDAGNAVTRADEIFGNVVDRRLSYVFEAGNRKTGVSLSGFEEIPEQAGEMSSIAVCVDELLKYEGVYEDNSEIMKQGNVLTVLSNNLPEKEVLDLTGCSLSPVLYYLSKGHPVLAFVEDLRTVLIVGYDSRNVTIYDPTEGTVTKYGTEVASAWFAEGGNKYISYVD